jgi:hypothetical protein
LTLSTSVRHDIIFQAGIKGNQLMLALEPEAAAMFCKQMALSKTDDLEVSAYQPGKKFMVVDCGGKGTIPRSMLLYVI